MKRIYVVVLAGVLALCVTGGAVAASQITGKDIKNGSVTGKDIKNGSLGKSELSKRVRNQLAKTGAKGDTGPQGPKGDTGDRGPAGPKGETGEKGDQGEKGEKGEKGDTGDRGPAGSDGSWFPAGFFITNKSVGLTASGGDFGPYADGGAAGGSVLYTGLNGKTLSDIAELKYAITYETSDDKPIGVPYLRIFLNDDNDDVIYDPTECATASPPEDTRIEFDVVNGAGVRYDDDACDGVAPDQQPWADVVAAHGDDVISGVYVTTGFSGGADLHAWLNDLTINGKAFHFGA